MFPHGGRSGGIFRGSRLVTGLMVMVTVVAVMGFVAPALMGSPTAISGGPATSAPLTTAHATPTTGTPPEIYYFSAYPPEFTLGGSTDLDLGAFTFDAGFLSYAYAGLPTGCATANTTFLFCTPTAYGTFNVTAQVHDSLTALTATSQINIIVDPILNGTFFSVNASVIPNLNYSNAACTSYDSPPFYQNSCAPEAETPNLLPLANGNLGLASELLTDSTNSACPGASQYTVGQVGFSISHDNGTTFGPAATLGNTTSCNYLDAIEPSFAVSGWNVFGTFIEENSTLPSLSDGNRSGDALAFIRSYDNGTSFTAVHTIDPSGNLARPALAVSGKSIYIVYENVMNSTTAIGGGVLPISLEFIASFDAGRTWTSPITLPGLGSGQGYNAMSPSIAVSSTGTVAVAYATDRTCTYLNLTGCGAWSDSIVVATSSDNGSAWQGPSVVATGAGESTCFTGGCLGFFFQSTPQTAIAFDPTGSYLYVAYAATYDQGLGASALNYNHTGVFAAVSSDGGSTWASAAVVAPPGATAVRSFNPGLGVSAQGVYLTYLQANESSGYYGLANSLSQWVDTAPTGATLAWNPASIINVDSFATSGGSVNTTRSSFSGYSSSVAFNATGDPWVAFALPGSPTTTTASSTTYYYVNTTYPTSIGVASLAIAGAENTVVVNFTETGLPAGTPWMLYLDGVSYHLDVPSVIFMNIPIDTTMLVGAYYNPTGEWTIIQAYFNATTMSFGYNQTYEFPFAVWVGMEFNFFPSNQGYWWTNGEFYVDLNIISTPFPTYIDAEWEDDGYYYICNPTCHQTSYNYMFYDSPVGYTYCSVYGGLCSWTSPWYFPLGSVISLGIEDFEYGSLPAVYTSGTGTGAYNGYMSESEICEDFFNGYCYYYEYVLGTGEIQMDGPIQETIWLGDAPENLSSDVTFSSSGLPAGSVFHATFNGSTVSGTPSAPAVVADVAPGAYSVSNVWASAPTPGWEYFGSVEGPNPFVPPLETAVTLRFDALENLSAPAGVVTFYAAAVSPGTVWSLTFNSTTYTSPTPWINITTHPGTFAYTAGDAIAQSGTAGYVPTTPSGNFTVKPGSTYDVPYTPAYEVLLSASTGGLVSANHGAQVNSLKDWVAAGTSLPISETPSSGYAFAGWVGTGDGSYNGTSSTASLTVTGPIVETASYLPLPGARFNLTFVANGLSVGTWWTVNLNGVGYSSDVPTLTVSGLYAWSAGIQGHYNLTVPTAYASGSALTRYVPATYPGVVGANGTLTGPVELNYLTEDQVSLTLSGDGTVQTTYQGAPTGTSVWAVQGSQVSITASAYPGWTFSGWDGTGTASYSGTNATQVVTVTGPFSEVALFTQNVKPAAVTYTVTYTLTTPLATGTTWGVTLGGVGYSTTGTTLTVSNVSANTYAMEVNSATAPSGMVQYRSTSTDPVAITVHGNQSIDVAYDSYYYVSVSSSVGGSVSPGSDWYASGSVLYLVASPNAAENFGSWVGSGSGSYSGPNSTASLVVTGPITEVANFQTNSGATVASSVWSNPATWAGFGGAALVIGIAVGVILARLGARKAPSGGPQGNPRATSPPPKGGEE
jgi:Divergent InlB B-repeat domain